LLADKLNVAIFAPFLKKFLPHICLIYGAFYIMGLPGNPGDLGI